MWVFHKVQYYLVVEEEICLHVKEGNLHELVEEVIFEEDLSRNNENKEDEEVEVVGVSIDKTGTSQQLG